MLAGLGVAYAWAWRRWAPRDPLATDLRARRQKIVFALGLAAMWIASDWPVHDVSEHALYSVHMVQHLLLSFVAAPLLLMGTPSWMARRLLGTGARLAVVRTLCRPLVALVVYNLVIAVTHWPAVVDLTMRTHGAHFVAHAVLITSSLVMWMPVASPLMEVPRLSYPGQLLYLFGQSLLPTVPASFLTFGQTPLYHYYETLPRLWGVSALDDMRVAGLVMKIVGGFLLWGVIAVLFFKWHAIEEREGLDVLEWRDVDRQLNRAGVAPTNGNT